MSRHQNGQKNLPVHDGVVDLRRDLKFVIYVVQRNL